MFENAHSQQQVDPNMVSISTANLLRIGKLFGETFSNQNFSGVQSQKDSFTTMFS